MRLVNISERSRKQLEELISLERKTLGQYTLAIDLKPILLPPYRLFSGRTYFSIYLQDDGHCSQKPVVDRALYSVGGKGVLPWIEIGYYWADVIFQEERTVPKKVSIANSDSELTAFVDRYPQTEDLDLVRVCKNNARKIRDLIGKNCGQPD